MTTGELTEKLKSDLKRAGFSLVRTARIQSLEEEGLLLRNWLNNKYHAGMSYMERNTDTRINPQKIDESFVSAISAAIHYNSGEIHAEDEKYGKISRYAWGKDYHLVMWEMLDTVIEGWRQEIEDLRIYRNVDTGPVMDKVWAIHSGIGWQGKHSNVINQQEGSWFFLSTIFINKELEYDTRVEDMCGSCTACIDACPTAAIEPAYTVQSEKCISYQTIENKGEIATSLTGKFNGWMFGCDICQDVCPWNIKFAALTDKREFFPVLGTSLPVDYFNDLSPVEFKEKFSESPLLRAKLKGMKRNAQFIVSEQREQ